MPVLKIKKDGNWKDIASAYTHSHTISDITNLPENLVDEVNALKDKVGADSVAYQVQTAIETAVGYEHPETHPADMITGLSAVATSGSYNDLNDLPEIGDALPEITDEDDGKVLGVVGSEWQKMSVPKELPTVTAEHNGKLLGVVGSEWAIVNAPEGGTGGSGASVQADYAQNNENDPSYIANRPFYVGDPIIKEILPITELPFTYDSLFGTFGYGALPTAEQLEIWQNDWTTATIVWGDKTFVCEPQYYTDIKMVGNLPALMGTGNNGMPFLIGVGGAQVFGQDTFIVMSLVDVAETTRNVSVSVSSTTITTLDPKFLGDISWNKISNKPFYDIPAGTIVLDCTVNLTIQEDEGIYAGLITLDKKIVDGNYDIEWNGTVYNVDVIVDDNIYIQDSNTGFVGIIFLNNGVVASTVYGENIIKITSTQDSVVKIESKYLSETFPEVTTADDGKTLIVSEGKWTVGSGLPSVTSDDNGKSLVVSDGQWVIGSQLPATTSADAGKFLRVDAYGNWVAEKVSNAEEVTF